MNGTPPAVSLHTFHFTRGIGSDTYGALQNAALTAVNRNATEFRVYLSSDGGNNDAAFTAYHFLRSLPLRVTMHCIGLVESMAVILFLAADERIIVPHGRVKVHAMHFGFPAGPVDHDRLAEYVAGLDFDAKRYTDIFHERTRGAKEAVDVAGHLAGKARFLTATEAVAAGIATSVGDVAMPTEAVRWWI